MNYPPTVRIEEDSFDVFQEQAEREATKAKTPLTYTECMLRLYHKVGKFYGWSIPEFEATPVPYIMYLSREFVDPALKGEPYVDYTHLGLLYTLVTLFGEAKPK